MPKTAHSFYQQQLFSKFGLRLTGFVQLKMSRLLQSRLFLSSNRLFSTSSARTAFASSPAPPRLPPKEQEEFERLQRTSTGAFSTPRPSVTVNQNSSSSETPTQSRPQSPTSTT